MKKVNIKVDSGILEVSKIVADNRNMSLSDFIEDTLGKYRQFESLNDFVHETQFTRGIWNLHSELFELIKKKTFTLDEIIINDEVDFLERVVADLQWKISSLKENYQNEDMEMGN